MRRNFHPYISSTYINGYVKDQPLLNYEKEQVMEAFEKVNREFGRKPISHNGGNVLLQETRSVQGFWKDNMWDQYPKHLIEPVIKIKTTEVP